MTKVQVVKEALQHSLSQIRIALPNDITIQKVEDCDSVKLTLLRLLEYLPEKLKNYICASMAHCKSCGYHGPVPVIFKQQQVCYCGSSLSVYVRPLFYAFYYESASFIEPENLAALVTLDMAGKYHSILINQRLSHYILSSYGESKVFIKQQYALAYFKSYLDSEFYPRIGRPLLAIYTNNNTVRELQFESSHAIVPIGAISHASAAYYEYYVVSEAVRNDRPYQTPNTANNVTNFQIQSSGTFYRVSNSGSTTLGVCDCCGMRCLISRTVNALACWIFCFIFLLFVINIVLFSVCMALKLQNSEVFVADAIIVRGNALFGYDTDEAGYQATIDGLREKHGNYSLYAYTLRTELVKTPLLDTPRGVSAPGVAADEIVLVELSTQNLTVYEDTRLQGYYLRFQGVSATFSENTNVSFGVYADFIGDIRLQRAEIADLVVENLNFSGVFMQNGYMEDFYVDQLVATAGNINNVDTYEMTVTDATVERFTVQGSASVESLRATVLNVTSDLTILDSQMRLPYQIELSNPLNVNGEIRFLNKTRMKFSANATIYDGKVDSAILSGGKIETAAVKTLNLTSVTLSDLNASSIDFKSSVRLSGQQIIYNTNGAVVATFGTLQCNETFQVMQNFTANELRTRSVNITDNNVNV